MLVGELGDLAASLDILDISSLPGHVAPVEYGDTYRANARLKARAAADGRAAVLADDSGIEVAALGGAPGIHTARWALAPSGAPLDGAGLNRALLARMGDLADRRAAMVSTVVLAIPGQAEVVGQGRVTGRLALDQRGSGGFGYDAVFVLDDGRRLSEVPGAEKDRVGHRGQAVRACVPALITWLTGSRRA